MLNIGVDPRNNPNYHSLSIEVQRAMLRLWQQEVEGEGIPQGE
jgi:hypothetical protein